MISGSVPAGELDPKLGLRAQDYLISTDREAGELIDHWIKCFQLQGLFYRGGPQMKNLREMISSRLKDAYERGQKNGAT